MRKEYIIKRSNKPFGDQYFAGGSIYTGEEQMFTESREKANPFQKERECKQTPHCGKYNRRSMSELRIKKTKKEAREKARMLQRTSDLLHSIIRGTSAKTLENKYKREVVETLAKDVFGWGETYVETDDSYGLPEEEKRYTVKHESTVSLLERMKKSITK